MMAEESRTIRKLGVLINGTNLPVRAFVTLFEKQPFVIRDSKKKKLESSADPDAAYCAFNFSSADSISATLEQFRTGFGYGIAELAKLDSVEMIRYKLPVYLSSRYEETISPELLNALLLSDPEARIWLDCYFEAKDIVSPPADVTDNTPPGTMWFGGIMDSISLTIMKDDIPLPMVLDFADLEQPGFKLDEQSQESGHEGYIYTHIDSTSWRQNRSIEFSSTVLRSLCAIGYPIKLSITHAEWEACG